MKPKTRKITIRFSAEEDADLLAWYDNLRGKKGEEIKNILRRQLSLTEKKEAPQLDASNLLADIRQIVDISIKGALEEYAIPSEKKATEIEEDTEANDLLDMLINNNRVELENDASEPKNAGWGDSW
ncbi:MAG: hypothetical protein HN390_01815 [Anaerolineae bacterium]|jgi:hypothetical protein|nr:hypothetical protein [Anaerolineae bacterium]MBT7190478.1 hypothetical protein [Anaerolineae bacterium]MBT7774243.1 hypothetical protein [Anaerolineae bacterium]